jgi:GNAT superfamily N-acetyltransferase
MRAMAFEQAQRIRRAHREGGWQLVLRKALSKLDCEIALYELGLDGELAPVASGLELEIRPIAEADLAAYLALRPDEDPADVRERLRRGDLGLGSWSGGEMIGGAWVRFDRVWVSELGRTLRLLPGEAYGYASFTDPRYRLRGAAAMLYEATLRRLHDLGHRRVLAYVVAGNEAGHASLRKLHFERAGQIRWLHLDRFGVAVESRGGRRRVRVHVRPRNGGERWTSS